MKKFYVILAIVLLSNSYLPAQNEVCKTVLKKGIALFNSGKYTEAKEQFEAAKKRDCTGAQSWIDKCTAKLNTPVQSVKSQKQIQCEQRFKDGKESLDKGDYETALIFL